MRQRAVAVGAVVVVAGGMLAGLGFAWRAASSWFGGCRATPLVVRHLADRLAPQGLEPIMINYRCAGSWTNHDDDAGMWLAPVGIDAGADAASQRQVADRQRQAVDQALRAAGWRAGRPSAPPSWAPSAQDDALLGGAPSAWTWDAGFTRDAFVLDLKIVPGAHPVLELRLKNTGGKAEVPRGVDRKAEPLPERAPTEEELLRHSSAPVVRSAAVPPGFTGWAPTRPGGLLTTYRSLLPTESARLARLVAGQAPAGLDPARTCGTDTWGRFGDATGCLLVGERGGVKIYVPYHVGSASGMNRSAPVSEPLTDGDVVWYGPPMALIGTTTVILDKVGLQPGEVVVQGQQAVPPVGSLRMGLDDVLTVFASVKLGPPGS